MKKQALIALGLASVTLAGLFLYQRHTAAAPHEAGPGTIIEGLNDEGARVTFRIESIASDPRDADGETHLYGLSIKAGEEWSPYCTPDADGRRVAIPLRGSFDVSASNMFSPGGDTLTFACTSGAIGKCVRLGYKPWREERASLHAACVRMIRADYCGDGRSHTKDGTRIDIFDRQGIQKADADDGHREELEAGWSPSGATYLNVPRWSEDVAAIVAECPSHLAHRTSLDERLTSDQVTQRFPETLLFDKRMHDPKDRLPAR